MAVAKIGVGIIGVSPERGWAQTAHLPALKTLADTFEVRAISSTRRAAIDQAAKTFGVKHAFDSHAGLIACADVDLVVVTVKVPAHRELVTAALEADKAVYCEWPLGRDLAEAQGLAALAHKRNLRTVVGLQARAAPAIRHLRSLLADGYVGDILSVSVVGSGMNWGDSCLPGSTYLQDRANGASLLTIPFGHSIDALCWCIGEIQDIGARTAIRYPKVRVTGTDETVARTAPDQIAVTGFLQNGALVSIHYRGGRSRGNTLLIEINGTEGDLVVTAPSGHLQIAEAKLSGARGNDSLAPIPIPASCIAVPNAPAGPPYNVAQVYRLAADAWDAGKSYSPGFDAAVERHRMLAAIEEAAAKAR